MNEKSLDINVHDPFYQAVKAVFDNWTAFQLAVSHSFAGAQTQEAADWFLNSTYQWVLENPDLESHELEEFLADTMEQELNSVLEDDSETQVAALLLKFADMSRTGKVAELNHEIETKLCTKNASNAQKSVKAKRELGEEESSSDEDEDEQDEPMDEEEKPKAKGSALTKDDEKNFQQMDEGWTLITKSGKHLSK